MHRRPSLFVAFTLLALAVAGLFGLSLASGSVPLRAGEVLEALTTGSPSFARDVILELRLPRVLAAFAVGGLLRLHEQLAVQTSVGLENTGVQRSRATISSVWQPSKLGVLFAEWAGSELGTEAHRVGGRWWIVPRRLSIDLGARRLPDVPGWVDPRVGLSLSLPL